MGLDFSGATSDKLNCGSGSSLDNLTTATYLTWFKVTNATPAADLAVSWKGLAASGSRQCRVEDTLTEATITIFRATTNLTVSGDLSLLAVDEWNCLAYVHDTGGADGDQQIYEGNLTNLLTEVGSYGTQVVGAGTPGDNSANNLIIGNRENDGRNFDGIIAFIAQWNRVLTLAELRQQQWHPFPTSGCVLWMQLGFLPPGTGTQLDLSGNGNNGTVTGAAKGEHTPISIPMFHRPIPILGTKTTATNTRRYSLALTGVG